MTLWLDQHSTKNTQLWGDGSIFLAGVGLMGVWVDYWGVESLSKRKKPLDFRLEQLAYLDLTIFKAKTNLGKEIYSLSPML